MTFMIQRKVIGHNLIILIRIIENLNLICFKRQEIFDILGRNVSEEPALLQMFASAKEDSAGRIALNVGTSVYFIILLGDFLFFFDLAF